MMPTKSRSLRLSMLVGCALLVMSASLSAQIPLQKSARSAFTLGAAGSFTDRTSLGSGFIGGSVKDRFEFAGGAGYLSAGSTSSGLVGALSASVYPVTGSMTRQSIYISLDAGGTFVGSTSSGGSRSGVSTMNLGATFHNRLFTGKICGGVLSVGMGKIYPLTGGYPTEAYGMCGLAIGLYSGDNFLSLIPSAAVSSESTTLGLQISCTFVQRVKETNF